MTFIDFIMILVLILGIIIGWNNGVFKTLINIFVLFIAMIIASLLRGYLASLLYKTFPFFNLSGLYSPNILIHQLASYTLILILIILIFQTIMRKTGLEDKMANNALITSLPSKILGMIFGISLCIICSYNVFIILKYPTLNNKMIQNSYFAPKILEKTFLVSNLNSNLYYSLEYTTDAINKYKKEKKVYVDTMIIDNLYENDLISYDSIESLRKKKALPKYYYYEEDEEVSEDE